MPISTINLAVLRSLKDNYVELSPFDKRRLPSELKTLLEQYDETIDPSFELAWRLCETVLRTNTFFLRNYFPFLDTFLNSQLILGIRLLELKHFNDNLQRDLLLSSDYPRRQAAFIKLLGINFFDFVPGTHMILFQTLTDLENTPLTHIVCALQRLKQAGLLPKLLRQSRNFFFRFTPEGWSYDESNPIPALQVVNTLPVKVARNYMQQAKMSLAAIQAIEAQIPVPRYPELPETAFETVREKFLDVMASLEKVAIRFLWQTPITQNEEAVRALDNAIFQAKQRAPNTDSDSDTEEEKDDDYFAATPIRVHESKRSSSSSNGPLLAFFDARNNKREAGDTVELSSRKEQEDQGTQIPRP